MTPKNWFGIQLVASALVLGVVGLLLLSFLPLQQEKFVREHVASELEITALALIASIKYSLETEDLSQLAALNSELGENPDVGLAAVYLQVPGGYELLAGFPQEELLTSDGMLIDRSGLRDSVRREFATLDAKGYVLVAPDEPQLLQQQARMNQIGYVGFGLLLALEVATILLLSTRIRSPLQKIHRLALRIGAHCGADTSTARTAGAGDTEALLRSLAVSEEILSCSNITPK